MYVLPREVEEITPICFVCTVQVKSFHTTRTPHITLGQWAGFKGAPVDRTQDKWTPFDFDVVSWGANLRLTLLVHVLE